MPQCGKDIEAKFWNFQTQFWKWNYKSAAFLWYFLSEHSVCIVQLKFHVEKKCKLLREAHTSIVEKINDGQSPTISLPFYSQKHQFLIPGRLEFINLFHLKNLMFDDNIPFSKRKVFELNKGIQHTKRLKRLIIGKGFLWLYSAHEESHWDSECSILWRRLLPS